LVFPELLGLSWASEGIFMEMKWYVIHTYSGYENKVKSTLEDRIKLSSQEEYFSEIVIPTENVVEVVKGEKKTTSRKFFPGYVLVNMIMNNETWHTVRNTPKVTGFIGGGNKPVPIPSERVKEILHQISEGKLRPKPKVSFEKGDSVRIVDGPFTNFNGMVEEVKPEKGRLKVSVSIFGRATPIELEFLQVKKN
jgi:transcriptional antiterminator NusG